MSLCIFPLSTMFPISTSHRAVSRCSRINVIIAAAFSHQCKDTHVGNCLINAPLVMLLSAVSMPPIS